MWSLFETACYWNSNGKFGYAAYATPAVAPIRLADAASRSAVIENIQVSIIDVARSVTGKKLEDHIPVHTLLEEAQIPSCNQMAVKALATETWKAASNLTEENKAGNPLGNLIFNSRNLSQRATRSANKGLI